MVLRVTKGGVEHGEGFLPRGFVARSVTRIDEVSASNPQRHLRLQLRPIQTKDHFCSSCEVRTPSLVHLKNSKKTITKDKQMAEKNLFAS